MALAACAIQPREPHAISATKPTITYAYSDERSLIDASAKADAYCAQFNAAPRTSDIYNKPEGGRNVTFVCDRPIPAVAATPATAGVTATNPVVSYTYRDDRGLVDATGAAMRHCATFAAQARSTTMKLNTDGSKTISFECVKTS